MDIPWAKLSNAATRAAMCRQLSSIPRRTILTTAPSVKVPGILLLQYPHRLEHQYRRRHQGGADRYRHPSAYQSTRWAASSTGVFVSTAAWERLGTHISGWWWWASNDAPTTTGTAPKWFTDRRTLLKGELPSGTHNRNLKAFRLNGRGGQRLQ